MIELHRYKILPLDAQAIRQAVFIQEQGFEAEFDEIDHRAIHIVLSDEQGPQGTCRVFILDNALDSTICVVGRVAVQQGVRHRGYGSLLMQEAFKVATEMGGVELRLHAQLKAQNFYAKQGFTPFGEIELDEGVEHIWMKKVLKNTCDD